MRVLLPPSETKRSDGGNVVFSAGVLAFHTSLGETRQRVAEALATLSADETAAMRALKLGVKSKGELQHNLRLQTAHASAATLRYTGVLFDALNAEALDAEATAWLRDNVFIQSALFGLISAGDPIPPYRLSATTSLPVHGQSLKALWNNAHASLWESDEFVVDLRSKAYAALAPVPAHVPSVSIDVVTSHEDGALRALNHFNKRAKGLFVRELAVTLSRDETEIPTLEKLIAWARANRIDLRESGNAKVLQLVTTEGAPTAAARPKR